jgi:hypothetical protein
LLARLAAFGFILEAFVVKEDLLSGSPDKIFITVNTFNGSVLILALGTGYEFVGGFRLCHDVLPGSLLESHNAGGLITCS